MNHDWVGTESRWGDRVKVNIWVRLSMGTMAGTEGCMSNLSLSGALVKANVDLGLHSLIEVSITMPPPRRVEVIRAYVSRKLDEGIGVEWGDFAPAVIKDILRSLAMRPPL